MYIEKHFNLGLLTGQCMALAGADTANSRSKVFIRASGLWWTSYESIAYGSIVIGICSSVLGKGSPGFFHVIAD